MTDREELWIKVRKVLVEVEVMKPNGEPNGEENEKACRDMRRLILSGKK